MTAAPLAGKEDPTFFPVCTDQDMVKSLVGVVCSCHAHEVRVLALRAIRQGGASSSFIDFESLF
jgi:hypothetical protein